MRAWELDTAGYTQREIAAALQVSQPAVCKMLRRTADRLIAARQADQARQQVRLAARNDRIYRESLRAYERSQQNQTRRRQRQILGADGAATRSIIDADVRERDGDPRFLEQAGRALERAVTIHGLDRQPRRPHPVPPEDSTAIRERLARVLGAEASRGPAGPAPPPAEPE
jgi:predicted transcriptional regulator